MTGTTCLPPVEQPLVTEDIKEVTVHALQNQFTTQLEGYGTLAPISFILDLEVSDTCDHSLFIDEER